MTDPLDTLPLRNDLVQVCQTFDKVWHEDGSPSVISRSAEAIAGHVMDFLAAASGDERHAILRILGYDVSEGVMVSPRDTMGGFFKKWIAYPYLNDPEAYVASDIVPVLVLRDQRDTTDG